MELTWLFVVLIIITGLAVLLLLLKPKLAHIESFSGFKDEQMAFADNQYTYYHDKMGKELLVNPGIEFDRAYASIQQPGTILPVARKSSMAKRFQRDPHNKFTDDDKKFCRGAKEPANLPARPKKATVACGWWFMAAPDKSSTGALGRRDKPMFPETLPAGGEWIWDIKTAIKKEEIKRCKQIKNCNLIDMKALKGRCGFCPDLGVAVPVGSNKKEKYPEDTLCGTQVAMSSDQCPKPAPPPVETPEGVSCGNHGSASADGRIRVYTKDECAAVDPKARLEGVECLKPGGGSYSWDCRDLNGPMIKTTALCDPDESGKLTRPCLLSLCQGMGYTKAGTIVKMLMDSNLLPSEMDTMAIQVLSSIGVAVPTAVMGEGDIDADSASDIYYHLVMTANGSSSELYKEAAKWLVFGTDNFDPCNIPDNTIGPFVPQCIQREFRKAGCQPAGSEYPGSMQKLGKFAGYAWGDVKREFSSLYNEMSNSDGDEQDKAIPKCLGIGIKREPPGPCKITGVWRYMYNGGYIIDIKPSGGMNTVRITFSGNPSGTVEFNEKSNTGNFVFEKGAWKVPFSVVNGVLYWQNSAAFMK